MLNWFITSGLNIYDRKRTTKQSIAAKYISFTINTYLFDYFV